MLPIFTDSERRRATLGWILFDPACQPYFTLITTFIFAPYFASAVAPTPAEGQALWGFATGAAGLFIAFCSPVLGAVADASGRRKPWIALFGAMLMIGSGLLWFATPGDESRIPLILVAFAVGTIGVEFATVFNNAMMPNLAPPERLGRLSGIGWAAGYFGGLVSLAVMLAFFSTRPDTGLTLLGAPPAFGLDAATRQGDRLSGPFTAVWFAVLVLPLFLLVPDPPAAMPMTVAAKTGLSRIRALLPRLRTRPMLARFLIGNMIYADGLVALFAFGGIYAAGVFGWGSVEIGIFGILLTITGTLGALAGGWLDDRFGSRIVILVALGCLIVACVGLLSLARDSLLFGLVPTAPGTGLFATVPERAYLGLGLLIGAVAGPLQAASRTLLVRLAPPEHLAECFGLFALSGRITSFAAPTTVAVVTAITASQRAGVGVLLVFFGLGAWLIAGLRGVPRPGRA
ncbi:MFS transporter [Xanthobacter agilis]|uniref:UMF1 family MFS transporter n=1 Tax=Xanthobacter agilis TaxID=47492 RepID=A0ABU0LD39_XANAG|nr:MFS transporter [Xanthobacter agilis]MDQ0505034.1 UMF1 family MFS transporter [Xanthobacter agilis]